MAENVKIPIEYTAIRTSEYTSLIQNVTDYEIKRTMLKHLIYAEQERCKAYNYDGSIDVKTLAEVFGIRFVSMKRGEEEDAGDNYQPVEVNKD